MSPKARHVSCQAPGARDACEFFTAEMNLAVRQRLALETGLRNAIERGELRIDYQAQADAATGRWVGAEALLRWEHPDQGRILPSTFIPLAEESRQIFAIGDWVLTEALRQVGAWRAEGLSVPRLAVNISPVEIRAAGFRRAHPSGSQRTRPAGPLARDRDHRERAQGRQRDHVCPAAGDPGSRSEVVYR